MKTVSLGVVVAAMLAGLGACSDSEAPATQDPLIHQIPVVKLDAPATVAPGASVDVVLTVEVGGCVGFDHIAEVRSGSQINLAAWGKSFVPPPNAACVAY